MATATKWPKATYLIILINLAVFLYASVYQQAFALLQLVPDVIIPDPTQIYRAFTYMFVHHNIAYFMINVLMIGLCGMAGEKRLGSMNFFIVYVLSGLIVVPFAILASQFTHDPFTLANSSGSVFGIMVVTGAIAGWESIPTIITPILNLLALPSMFLKMKNIKVPLFVGMFFYLLFYLFLFALEYPDSLPRFVQFTGALGGVIGLTFLRPKSRK